MKSLLVSLIKFFSKLAEQSSLLRRIAVFILKPFPSIKNRLINVVVGHRQSHFINQNIPTELSPHARQIYKNLKMVIDKHKRIED